MQPKKGLILVSSPPKSGKSTLAYAMLKDLKSENIGIMTVEDSIKWHLKDIDQCQINAKAGFKRADAIASCMKLHPKVIYIQNIDDPDITEPICRGVEDENIFFIASIESKDVFEALEKTIRLGLHQAVSLIINQQCVRRLCDHCKEPYQLSPAEIDNLFIWDQKTEVTVFREKGCSYCRQAGFFDRIGVHEVLSINDNLRSLINNKVPMTDIIQMAKQSGYRSKAYDGTKKVLRGLTTFNEISEVSSP